MDERDSRTPQLSLQSVCMTKYGVSTKHVCYSVSWIDIFLHCDVSLGNDSRMETAHNLCWDIN
jgi:hypothetical protein